MEKVFGKKNLFAKAALCLFVFAMAGCRSTKKDLQTQILADGLEINAQDNEFRIYESDVAQDIRDGEKFIFIRLYFPNYTNPVSGVSILKHLINAADPNPEEASHSAIGFSLEDTFYGLTTYTKRDLKIEHCTNHKTNPYMKMCNPYTSIQTTLAIKVSEEEYEYTKSLVEEDFKSGKIKYSIPKNLPVGLWEFKRKKFKKPQKILGGTPSKKGYNDSSVPEKNFVCSSYLAYILDKGVKSVHEFFVEKQLGYDYIIPTDLYYFPGMKILFKSTWVDYNIAAEEFVLSQPHFVSYLP